MDIVINTNPSVAEMYEFVERVTKGSVINGVLPSKLHEDIAFHVTFLDMFTNIALPTKTVDGEDVIDTEKAWKIRLNSADSDTAQLMTILRGYVNDRVEFEKRKILAVLSSSTATDEVLESISLLASKGIELTNKAIDVLDKSGNKLLKGLTQKKINEFISGIQKSLVDAATQGNLHNG